MKKNQNASQQLESESSGIIKKLQAKETWFENDRLTITFDPNDFSIMVTEQPPLPFRITFCGGGARIPAHIGAYDVLKSRGLHFTEFSGSSAGAMVAALAYLGYDCSEIYEIISWFDEDKLLDTPVEFSLNNIKQIFAKGGVSSPKSLHQAANYVILKKVMDIITDKKYKHLFESHQDFLKENIFDSHSCITFGTLSKIKEICPECNLGDKLYVIGTDLSKKEFELFSAQTTPDMGVADAIVISSNLPIAFERILYNGKIYSDGGITKNYPIGCFSDSVKERMFLRHEHDVDFSVIGLQFDNGKESDALYSEKPIFQWSWLSSQFYSFWTGHPNTTDNWHKDLQELRRHAQQSILINAPTFGISRLTLNEEEHAQVVTSGKKAATNYLNDHGYYIDKSGQTIRNEWLYEKFLSPEEIVNYCYEQKEFDVLRTIQQSIRLSSNLEKGYQQYLDELCEKYLSSDHRMIDEKPEGDAIPDLTFDRIENEKESGPSICKSLNFFSPQSEKETALTVHTSDLKIKMFTKLYPLFMQNWQKLCPISGIGDILNSMRSSMLYVETAHKCIQFLIEKLQAIDVGHFLVFMFKLALKYYEECNFDSMLKNLKFLYNAVDLIEKKKIHGEDRFYGQWDFEGQDTETILGYLKNDDISSLMKILDVKRTVLSIENIGH